MSSLAVFGIAPRLAFAAAPLDSTGYADMVGSVFNLANSVGPGKGKVKLVSVQELPSADPLHQFVLHFRGGRNRDPLPEGLYAATNWSGHPYFNIHIQPAGIDDRGGVLYIANFAKFG